jgi:DNA primase
VNYDPDAAGQAATERSLSLLLEKEFDVRVLALPGGSDPDKFIKEKGAASYTKLLREAPSYFDYLIARARQMDRTTPEGKLAAVNFLMPYAQRIPNALLRSELASKIASELRVEEPVLREALRRAVAERRSEVKPKAELMTPSIRPAERRLMQMLVEAEGFRENLAICILEGSYHKGLETEKIFQILIETVRSGAQPEPAALAAALAEHERKLLFEVLFETGPEASWEEAQSCLSALKRRQVEQELSILQRMLESQPGAEDRRQIFTRAQELRRLLAELQ